MLVSIVAPGHQHPIYRAYTYYPIFIKHDDVNKWKYFPRYWPFVWRTHQSPVNSPNEGQWCGALMCSLISSWINGWVSNHKAGDLRHHRTHYDVILISVKHNCCLKFMLNKNYPVLQRFKFLWWTTPDFAHQQAYIPIGIILEEYCIWINYTALFYIISNKSVMKHDLLLLSYMESLSRVLLTVVWTRFMGHWCHLYHSTVNNFHRDVDGSLLQLEWTIKARIRHTKWPTT